MNRQPSATPETSSEVKARINKAVFALVQEVLPLMGDTDNRDILLKQLCLPLLPQEAPAYSSLAPRLITYHRMEPDAALLLFALCCLVLFRLEKSSRSS